MKALKLLFFFSLLALSAFGQIQTINIGGSAHSGSADRPREAFDKINDNFELTLTKILTRNRVTDDYVLVLTDNLKLVEMNAATTKTITVPPNSSVAFTADQTQITLARYGDGAVNVVAGSGVTINSADGALGLRSKFSTAMLIKIGTNEWYLIGDIQ